MLVHCVVNFYQNFTHHFEETLMFLSFIVNYFHLKASVTLRTKSSAAFTLSKKRFRCNVSYDVIIILNRLQLYIAATNSELAS